MNLLCPLCGMPLELNDRTWRCEAGHCYDVARQGYVNLLPVQQKRSLHPGDTAEQLHARRRFLSAGHYAPISDTVCTLLAGARTLLDVGCGEGWYLRKYGEAHPEADRWGLDISRDAVRLAAGADKSGRYLVASAARLPFPDGSFDALSALFSLTLPEEFARVLAPGGLFLQALAEPDHLEGLKSLIYPELLHHPKDMTPALPGFRLKAQRELRFEIMLTDQSQIRDLLSMTPHFWRITREGAQRAAEARVLRDTAHVRLNLYQLT